MFPKSLDNLPSAFLSCCPNPVQVMFMRSSVVPVILHENALSYIPIFYPFVRFLWKLIIYTGCPIKNNSSLKPCHFGSDQFFFKRFSLYESLTVILHACHSAKLETFRICSHIAAKLSHFLKKYHLDF